MPQQRNLGGGGPHRYNERMTSAGPPRCPACGGLRLLPPSSFDPARRWHCLDCGATWAEHSEPAARRHLANPLSGWPPRQGGTK